MTTDLVPIVDGETVARVILHGDLSKLTPTQKVQYYRSVCESVGLNVLTQPFAYITLNGREVLYALKGATDQLRQVHKVAVVIVARELVEDVYIVTARASMPDGRTDESIGAVPIANLKGESRANAMMKAETKSKRRVTLSICGLGMLDETEVESLPMGAVAPSVSRPAVQPTSSAPALSVPAAATEENRGTSPLPQSSDRVGPALKTIDPAKYPPPPDPTPDDIARTEQALQAQADLPPGFVRVMHINTGPTKNPSVTKYFITFSNGEEVTTINSWLASLAENYKDANTPVRIKTRQKGGFTDLVALMTEEESKRLPPEPPPAPGEIPF